jgi:peptidoglycan hydrolase CwlO-like protein
MTPLFIILAQSVTGAVITIVALLLAAAIIGYLTAWFYAKSVYTPIIKKLEEEKSDLQKQVAGLKDDVTKLTGTVNELTGNINDLKGNVAVLEEKIAEKEKEIGKLRSRIGE